MATNAASVTGRSDVAWVFPGQGSQRVRMGRRLAAASPAAAAVFAAADRRLELPRSDLILEGPEEALQQTPDRQPAILATRAEDGAQTGEGSGG